MKAKPIDEKLIRELFIYHQGILYWAKSTSRRVRVGDVAGTPNNKGYCVVIIGGKVYRRSRLIYAMHYGDPASKEIDHINRDKSDDRIENLRAVDSSVNNHNKGLNRNNTSGIKGIYSSKTERGLYYRAKLQVGGKLYRKASYDLESLVSWRESLYADLTNDISGPRT